MKIIVAPRLLIKSAPQPDDCCYAEEIVGDDEGKVGGAEGQGVG
jgi:hypothetical protein